MNHSKAIEMLEQTKRQLEDKYRADLDEIDQAIAALSAPSASGSKPVEPPTVKPGQYRDMKAAKAAEAYLIDAGGGPLPLSQVVEALQRGGCKQDWQKGRFEQNLKIAISMNHRTLVYDEIRDTLRLARNRAINIA